jgi:CDP-diacylglycerol--serine O-phosphatidyltransferase
MQRIRNTIPNLLTLGNLACGLVAIVLLMDHHLGPPPYQIIGWLMLGAMVFDFFDGFVARALKVTSPIGKELDSLSDLVSFGVLPGLMVYFVLEVQMNILLSETDATIDGIHFTHVPVWMKLLPYFGLIIPLFSAWRLAKFNVDTRQSYGFLGLPTPANALFFLSIFLICLQDINLESLFAKRYYTYESLAHSVYDISWMDAFLLNPFQWLYNPWVLAGLTLIFSILLVTEIPLLAMKFKDYTWKGNWPRYVLILISVTLLAILWFRAIPLIIVLYFLFSFIDTRIHKKA